VVTGEPASERASARLTLLWIALAAVLVRLAPAALIHLTEDEAYYRLWAQHLQFGYYDHPPMTAWWIWLGQQVAGDTPLGLRLMSLLGVGASTWLLGDLALALGESRAAAVRTAVWYNATLIVALGGFLATPDGPASFFWIATLWLIVRAAAGRGAWWLAAGAAAGLALLSKYSSLFLAPGVLLWMLFDPPARRWLRRWEPWAAAVVAAAVFAPNIWWNANNHWITFAKQFGRAEAGGIQLKFLPEFLLTQFFLLNPLIAIFCVRGAVQSFAAARRGAPPARLLVVASSVPFLAYLVLHSLHARVQGHWPAPIYGPLALCAAVAAEQVRGRAGRLARVLGIGLGVAVLAHMTFPKVGSTGGFDPGLPLVGWPQFAGDVEQTRQKAGAAWVGAIDYGLVAQLTAEERSGVPVLQVNERARYRQDGPRPDFTRPGLVLDLQRRLDPEDLRRCFAVVRPVGVLERGFKAGPVVRYAAVVVEQPRRDIWTDGCHMKKDILPGFR
jgi:4-amino-4-deoxy-L-arabinose transferase-like glycosyltransferase